MGWNGKLKAITFSFDDGTSQDERLVKLFNQYGLKCTWNINSGLLGTERYLQIAGKQIPHNKIFPEQIKELYAGHEVAAHTLTHPELPRLDAEGKTEEIIRQVEQDRLALSKLCGYEVVGMAYPGGRDNNTDNVAEIIKNNTNIRYARTINSSYNFELPMNLYRWNPTVGYNEKEKMFQLADEFLSLQPDTPQLFYIWGHSFELDVEDTWNLFEDFLKKISEKEDIYYGTNKDVFHMMKLT